MTDLTKLLYSFQSSPRAATGPSPRAALFVPPPPCTGLFLAPKPHATPPSGHPHLTPPISCWAYKTSYLLFTYTYSHLVFQSMWSLRVRCKKWFCDQKCYTCHEKHDRGVCRHGFSFPSITSWMEVKTVVVYDVYYMGGVGTSLSRLFPVYMETLCPCKHMTN